MMRYQIYDQIQIIYLYLRRYEQPDVNLIIF
jgi:hypothetical protein